MSDRGPTCLVLGASGFLGSQVAARLAEAGHSVVGLARHPLAHHGSIRWVRADLEGPGDWAEGLGPVPVAIHAASLAGDWGPYRDLRARSARAHRALLDTLVKAKVSRLVLLSATPARASDPAPGAEEDQALGETGELCGDTKADAERLSWEAHRSGRIQVTVLRAPTCYGPGDGAFLPRLLAPIRAGSFTLVGDGEGPASLCHARHVADLCRLLATHPAAPGRTFHIRDRELLTWKQVVEEIAHRIGVRCRLRRAPVPVARVAARLLALWWRIYGSGGPPPFTPHSVDVLSRTYVPSFSRVRDLLSYVPIYTTREGLALCLGEGGSG